MDIGGLVTPTDLDMCVAIGAFVWIVSLFFVWHLGREKLALEYEPFVDDLEAALSESRRDAFTAQKEAYEADAKLQILQAQYIESRHELHAMRSRLEDLEQ